jgi:hypothetical protein
MQHHHWFGVIFCIFLAFAGGAGIVYLMHKASEERYIQAIKESTQAQKVLGDALAAAGHVVDYDEVAKRTKAAMGGDVMAEIRKTNGSVTTLTNSIATVAYEVKNLRTQDTTFKPNADGSFIHTFVQNRTPPLGALTLNYDPKRQINPVQGSWADYREVFDIGATTWRTENDGVRVATVVKRSVFDGTGAPVGSESLKIDKSDTFIPKDELRRFAPFPKYTFNILTSIDTVNGAKGFTFDTTKWFRRDLGITLGYTRTGPAKQINFGAAINVGTQ